MTVGELRYALSDVPDDTLVLLASPAGETAAFYGSAARMTDDELCRKYGVTTADGDPVVVLVPAEDD